jgi:hypothetical protein
MWYRYRVIHASQLLIVPDGIGHFIPTSAGIIQKIWVPHNTFMDEDAMEKDHYALCQNHSGRLVNGIFLGERLVCYTVAV